VGVIRWLSAFRAWASARPDFSVPLPSCTAYPFLLSKENMPGAAYVTATKSQARSSRRAVRVVLVNALFWKILVTRVKKFFAEFARSIERAENSAHFGKIAPGTAGG